MEFNGSGYITIPNPLNQSNLDQVWTVTAWVNITNGEMQRLLTGLNSGLYIHFMPYSERLLLYLNSGTNDYYIYSSQYHLLVDKGWKHITFVFRNNDSYRKIYVDGIDRSGSGPNRTNTPSGQSSSFRIGENVVGLIDDVRIYSRVLTAQEIQTLYAQTVSRYASEIE